MPSTETMSTSTGSTDTIGDIILQDHQEIRSLFVKYEQSSILDEKYDIIQKARTLLLPHESAEEEVLYPKLRKEVAGGSEIADERTQEEQGAEKLFKEIENMDSSSPDFISAADKLVEEVRKHASEEERYVLPALMQRFSQKELIGMGNDFKKAKSSAPTHPHPNAPHKGIGKTVAGKVAATMEHLQDKT